MPEHTKLQMPPKSWSELTWDQLNATWRAKISYGGNADVARAAALLSLMGMTVCRRTAPAYTTTGESMFTLRDADGKLWTVTPRELSQMAQQALPWFDNPYGDPGEEAVKDAKGKAVKEPREPVRGYVNPDFNDALALPIEKLAIRRVGHFALPLVALHSLTWQQYRALQGITPQLFRSGVTDSEATALQAQFIAHSLTPRSLALLDTSGRSIRLRPHYDYVYDADRAERLATRIQKQMHRPELITLFHILLQTYQTALAYYERLFPLLFDSGGKSDAVQDALKGESRTINAVMKYAGYAEQQQVYDSNLPFVLDILNTMAEEAKQIEQMNAKIKKK